MQHSQKCNTPLPFSPSGTSSDFVMGVSRDKMQGLLHTMVRWKARLARSTAMPLEPVHGKIPSRVSSRGAPSADHDFLVLFSRDLAVPSGVQPFFVPPPPCKLVRWIPWSVCSIKLRGLATFYDSRHKLFHITWHTPPFAITMERGKVTHLRPPRHHYPRAARRPPSHRVRSGWSSFSSSPVSQPSSPPSPPSPPLLHRGLRCTGGGW